MGNFYVNFSVKQPNQQQVADILRKRQRTALVTPAIGEYVVVFDEEADWQDDKAIQSVGEILSRETHSPVFAVLNHDDDVLAYWLFEDGQQTDFYNSAPDYFESYDEFETEDTGQGGDARRLCTTLTATASPEQIEHILRGDYVFAIERHEKLATALGLPGWSVGGGYRYITENGEVPDGLDEEQLVRVP
jgi:hypothetical protein